MEHEIKLPLSPENSVTMKFARTPTKKEVDQLQSWLYRLEDVYAPEEKAARLAEYRATQAEELQA